MFAGPEFALVLRLKIKGRTDIQTYRKVGLLSISSCVVFDLLYPVGGEKDNLHKLFIQINRKWWLFIHSVTERLGV